MEGSLPRAAVLMCHAPIVIPAIGRDRTQDCAATTAAMREAALTAIHSGAETLLILSPHTPRHRRSYGYVTGEILRGDFRSFGFHGLERTFRADAAAAAAVFRQAEKAGLPMDPTPVQTLDHGALVPLYFLEEAGFKGRVAVFAFPWESAPGESQDFGKVLSAAMRNLDRNWALIASGDMSHALQPGAPAGYHPRAQAFDEAVVTCVREGRLGDLRGIDPHLRNLAAEDVVESLETSLGALGTARSGFRVLSYEAPFGVGYLVAILREGGP
jgi:MEMO1 family protein